MDLSTEKQRPQKVEVVNNSENPTQAVITNFPLNVAGTRLVADVIITGNAASVGLVVRPGTGNYNVCLDNILLLQGDGTLVPVPLNTIYYNFTTANIDAMLASYKTAYATLVSGITAATLHYSKQANSGVVTSEVYDLKSND